MFKLFKKHKKCLLKIGIGVIVIVILFRLFKNTHRSNLVEGLNGLNAENQGTTEQVINDVGGGDFFVEDRTTEESINDLDDSMGSLLLKNIEPDTVKLKAFEPTMPNNMLSDDIFTSEPAMPADMVTGDIIDSYNKEVQLNAIKAAAINKCTNQVNMQYILGGDIDESCVALGAEIMSTENNKLNNKSIDQGEIDSIRSEINKIKEDLKALGEMSNRNMDNHLSATSWREEHMKFHTQENVETPDTATVDATSSSDPSNPSPVDTGIIPINEKMVCACCMGKKGEDYYFPDDNSSKFTKDGCAESCRARNMPFMVHGRDSRDKDKRCEQGDQNCLGRCYCYKKCQKKPNTAYTIYNVGNTS